jgi:hypothetical protein
MSATSCQRANPLTGAQYVARAPTSSLPNQYPGKFIALYYVKYAQTNRRLMGAFWLSMNMPQPRRRPLPVKELHSGIGGNLQLEMPLPPTTMRELIGAD